MHSVSEVCDSVHVNARICKEAVRAATPKNPACDAALGSGLYLLPVAVREVVLNREEGFSLSAEATA